MPALRGVRGNPENLDRQAAKIQAPGSGEGGLAPSPRGLHAAAKSRRLSFAYSDHQPLTQRAKRRHKRRQFGRMLGIEDAAHLLFVFADAPRQFGFADAAGGKSFTYGELVCKTVRY